MSRHLPYHRALPTALIFLSLALVGCSDDEPQAQIDSLRNSLAEVNAEVAALRASRLVLQSRLTAAQIAARTAGSQLAEHNSRVAGLSARNRDLEIANAQGAQRLRDAEAAIDHISGQLAAISQTASASEFNNANLARQLAAVSSLLGQRDAVGQSQENTLKALESDLHESSESLVELSEELLARQQALQQSQAKADQLLARNEQFAAQLAALQSKFDAAQTRSAQRIAQLERERGGLDATVSSMRTDSQSEQAGAQQLLESNKQIKARMETLRHELAEANDQALRYQVAKDYLIDKVQAQTEEIEELKKAGNEARAQHKATTATIVKQRDDLLAAAATRTEILNKAISRAETLQAEGDGVRDQLEQLRGDYAASEQRARGAKQAKDYLDGKLSAIAKELEEARAEHRIALLKNEHALRLSLEESRVLQQRERALADRFAQAQETSQQKEAELRALRDEFEAKIELARATALTEGLQQGHSESQSEREAELRAVREELAAKIELARVAGLADGKAQGLQQGRSEGQAEREAELRALREELGAKIELARVAGLTDGKSQGLQQGRLAGQAEHEAELRALREELDAKVELARAAGLTDGKAEGLERGRSDGRAEVEAELNSCMSIRNSDAMKLRKLQLDNDSLGKEVEALTARLQALESGQNDCILQKTQLSPAK